MRFCPTCGNRYEGEMYCPEDGIPTQVLPDEGPKVDPLIGRVLEGRYRVEKQIGEGGMGIVYLARHTVLGKKLAVKVLRGDMAKDKDIGERFIQEARSASEIGHPNIIDITDFGKLPDGTLFFVMELLEGESLTDMIGRGGSIPMQDAVKVIRQVASALGAAHARGIVHRDLKPDNIYLLKRTDNPLYVKVLDFGIAKVGGAASKLTKTGVIFGTPHYMAPEQAAGQPIDSRTDIYALGVIMYEMFAGRVPFDADTFMGILSKHMFQAPEPPTDGKGNRLGAIEDLIMRALAKKPEQRYSTMDDLLVDLDRIAAGGMVSIGQRGIAPPSLADALEPPTRTEMDLGRPDRVPTRRSPVLLIAGVGLLVLLGGGAAVAIALSGGDSEPSAPVATPSIPMPIPTPVPTVGTPPAIGPAVVVPTTPPPVAPVEEMVELATVPPGAQVTSNDAVLGYTPLSVPKPTEGDESFQLRLADYEVATVRLTRASPDAISLPLVRERTASRGGGGNTKRRPNPNGTTGGNTQGTGGNQGGNTDEPPRRRSEVVDPWAD